MNIKVNRKALIDKLEAEIIARQTKYDVEKAKYDLELASVAKKAKAYFIANVENTELYSVSRSGATFSFKIKNPPSYKSEPFNPAATIKQIKLQIMQLEMMADDVVSINSRNDYFRYISLPE